jgi:hypothetical protein
LVLVNAGGSYGLSRREAGAPPAARDRSQPPWLEAIIAENHLILAPLLLIVKVAVAAGNFGTQ